MLRIRKRKRLVLVFENALYLLIQNINSAVTTGSLQRLQFMVSVLINEANTITILFLNVILPISYLYEILSRLTFAS